MKAVVMAAGKGVRLMPLTDETPKVLITVAGKPFLYYVLKTLEKAGITDIALIVGYKKEQFPAFLETYGFSAKLIEQTEQLGTGHAILQAEEFCGEDNFIALGGDNVWGAEDIKAMINDDLFCAVSGIEVEHPEQYGVLVTEGDTLKEIQEKPSEPAGNLINTGLYKFTYDIFEALKRIGTSARGEYELTDAVTLLARQGKVKVAISGLWLDLGKKEDILKIEEFLKKHWKD